MFAIGKSNSTIKGGRIMNKPKMHVSVAKSVMVHGVTSPLIPKL